MKKPTRTISVQHGFSLVELLVVIAVIAIIAAIAIPNISNITGSAREASYQRNAQNIASVASAARAAGYATDWPTTVPGLLGVLGSSNGVQVTNGGNVMSFRVDAISTNNAAMMTGIATYLTVDTNNVIYNPGTN